jgi:hypothetical protein
MRRVWGVYLAVGLALLAYTGLGLVVRKWTVVPLTLRAGEMAEVSVLRVNAGQLRMEARFQGERRSRLQLELEARPSWQNPVRFAARSTGMSDEAKRHVLSSLPPDGALIAANVVFERGVNRISLVVSAVDQALIGETIEIWIRPALGLKFSERGVAWLAGSFWFPIYGLFYLVWGLALWGWQWRRSSLRAANSLA